MEKSKNINIEKRFHFDNFYQTAPKYYDGIALYQIGDLSCGDAYVLEGHVQVCYEITYIASGKGWFSNDGVKYPVSAGDIFIGVPEQYHEGMADSIDPFRYYYLGFNFIKDKDGQHQYANIENMMQMQKTPVVRDRLNIDIMFLNLLKEFNNLTQYSNIMIKNFMEQIIILMYRNFFSNWHNTYSFLEEKKDNKYVIYKVINYIDNNLLSIKDLTEIADVLGYSYSYLSHMFSMETGLTIRDYFSQKRLEKTVELLKSGEYNITQIAEILNYESIHSFSKSFKKSVGMSPSKYMKLHR
ncbi:AraC family transcriptional regulator [Clostridium polynesiense]|uniref:AraC family transcriptional regulator n=1 Tax=Clostridium polynesiense TaxID=1325933 RepID=UPI00058F7DBA|nr:helix-turn-helix domain-containing protein [Clostridium polynesiense]